MGKSIYNLLQKNTGDPILLSTTGATVTFGTPIVMNDFARDGLVYVETIGYSSVSAGFTPKLYNSFNGYVWFLNTSLPAQDTGASVSYVVDNLGKYLRMGYTVEAEHIGDVRVMLETNDELEI